MRKKDKLGVASPVEEPKSEAVEMPADVEVKGSVTPTGVNEAIISDENDHILRIYANKDDGKREKKYPLHISDPVVNAPALKYLNSKEQEEILVNWDGIGFPGYAVVGDKFAEVAEGLMKKLNEKDPYQSFGLDAKGNSTFHKNFGYKRPMLPKSYFEYQDRGNRTVQFRYKFVRPLKITYR